MGFLSATRPCVFFVGLVLRARDLVVELVVHEAAEDVFMLEV